MVAILKQIDLPDIILLTRDANTLHCTKKCICNLTVSRSVAITVVDVLKD